MKTLELGLNIDNAEIEWSFKENEPYRHMATLYHSPTHMTIEQASDKSVSEAKSACLKELSWRLQHWDAYQKSSVREIEV